MKALIAEYKNLPLGLKKKKGLEQSTRSEEESLYSTVDIMSNIKVSQKMPLRERNVVEDTHNGKEVGLIKGAETPITHRNRKITTPPESAFVGEKYPKTFLETPMERRFYEDASGNGNRTEGVSGKSALLSPAFSSPQASYGRRMEGSDEQSGQQASFQSSSSLETDGRDKLKKRQKKKKRENKECAFDFDSGAKPPYSYATLIGMSIMNNAEKKLTLSQIYQWISETFRYYRREEVGWQNSIRHNLSLNKAFVKGQKSKDGKGHFWCIQPGYENQFLKTKNFRKPSCQESGEQVNNNQGPKSPTNSIPSSPNAYQGDNKRLFHEIDNPSGINLMCSSSNNEDAVNGEDDTRSLSKRQKLEEADTDDDFDNMSTLQTTPYGKWPQNYFIDSNRYARELFLGEGPQLVVSESPTKLPTVGKNMAFTSSFSCNSNLDLSPLRPSETGPLLEPVTPANNSYRTSSSVNHLSTVYYHYPPSSIALHQSLQQLLSMKTPITSNKTPSRSLRTPQTSIMRRLCHSPSYLDEFYYSPLINSSQPALNSYDDDDMILRIIELPALAGKNKQQSPQSSKVAKPQRDLLGELTGTSSRRVDIPKESDLEEKENRNVAPSAKIDGSTKSG